MSSASPYLPPAQVTRPTPSGGCVRLKIYRTLWGINGDLYEFFKAAQAAGKPYEGFEGCVNFMSPAQKEQLTRARKEFNLDFAALVFSDLMHERETPAQHLENLKQEASKALEFHPVQINSHCGNDSWSLEEHIEFFRGAVEFAKTLPVPLFQETHRGRSLFNPWITRDIVKAVPGLLLNADYSHWVNVCERLLDGEKEQQVLKFLAPSVKHVHARVGFEQGPQVNDPRAPEWAGHVKSHENMWQTIFEAFAADESPAEKGKERVLTIVPEYGPGDAFCHYMPKLPYTQQPVTNLEEITDWAAARLQKLFIQNNKQ